MPWRGLVFLSGAQQIRFAPRVYRSFTAPISRPLVFSRAAQAAVPTVNSSGRDGHLCPSLRRVRPSANHDSQSESPSLAHQVGHFCSADPSLPSARGTVAPPGAATLAPSLGATNTPVSNGSSNGAPPSAARNGSGQPAPTTKLEHALKTAISAAHNAEKYGAELGYVVRFDADAIKSMAITVLINMSEGTRR